MTDETNQGQTSEQTGGVNPLLATTQVVPKPKFAPTQGANVALSATGKPLPEGLTNFGMHSVLMPSEEQQRAGFTVENPGLFIAQWPQFKFFKPKGE